MELDLRTERERKRDAEHRAIRRKYSEILNVNNGEGRKYKNRRIFAAVADWSKKAGLRDGKGYTSQSVWKIITN